MRQATIPDDMTSDVKNILGVISTRQLIYLIIGGSIIYSYIPVVFGLTSDFVMSVILCMISAAPVLLIVGVLGFLKNEKTNMFYDKYLQVLFFKKTQKGKWRKTIVKGEL
jgi:xanthosine utilization system XapX-like protein